MAKTKTTVNSSILKSKLSKVDEIDLNSTMLDAQYICNNNDDEKISITITMTGKVALGKTVTLLDNNHIIMNGKTILGTNNQLDGKVLNIYRSISGDEGTPCIMTIYLRGGYKDTVYHLSSKTGSSSVINFIASIEFI